MGAVDDVPPRKGSAPTIEIGVPDQWFADDTLEVSEPLSENEATAHPHRRNTSRARRDLPRLDLSRLFTRRKASKASNKASPLPTPSANHEFPADLKNTPLSPYQSWYRTTNAWGIRIRKPKSPEKDEVLTPRLNGLDIEDVEYQSPKIHIRKPPPGIQHWFDGVEDDAASVRLEPEGRPNMSPIKSLSKDNRDTFLSMSSAMTQPVAKEIAPEVLMDESPLEHPSEYFTERRRGDTVTSTLTQRPIRSHSQRSHSSGVTMKTPAFAKYQTMYRPGHLPDSINKEQSVLVLSEIEESDADDERSTGQKDYDLGRTSLDDASDSDACGQLHPGWRIEERRLTPRDGDCHEKKFHNVPDLVSTTSIDEGSQQTDDDHSPRTSLLSDMRPLSFRSEYRPISFKSEDRSVSIHPYETDGEQQAWLASPTSSQVIPPTDLSHYLTDNYLNESRPQTMFRNRPSGAQRLMVVTNEEANLLANMRRRRAEMAMRAANPCPVPRPLTAASRPSIAQPSSPPRRPAIPRDTIRQTTIHVSSFSPAASVASEAAMLSPCAVASPTPPPPQPKHLSTETVTHAWQDVQQWRKQGITTSPRPNTYRRPSLPHIETAPPNMTSHFSMSSSSPEEPRRTRPVLGQRLRSETARRGKGEGHKNRSRSLGDALRKREEKEGLSDVKADVLAAWGELGGWRRSGMSAESQVT